MKLNLRTPFDKEFQQICTFIAEFELDDRELKKDEFTVAFRGDELVGFGRLREHSDCVELCSLGVITDHRRKGIGKAIVAELIRRNPEKLYLICIIPDFFTPFGFKVIDNYPSALENKRQYCIQELIVPETYVVMQLHK